MRKNEKINFYSTQTFTVPNTGIYKLEVWGAKGGGDDLGKSGGNGGYSVGYKKLKAGTLLTVIVDGGGGSGGNTYAEKASYGGYSNGGGATYFSLIEGTMSQVGKEEFDKYGLIVAGGGGGMYYVNYNDGGTPFRANGGAGGGLSGGNGHLGYAMASGSNVGGTQTSGYAFGYGASNSGYYTLSGGGGGYYGGKCGAGGSGWIGGVEDYTDDDGNVFYKSMQNGVSVQACASLTLVKGFELKLGDIDVEDLYLGDTPVDGLALGDILL